MQEKKLIVKGEITVREELEYYIKPKGKLHLRALDPQIKRPFIFKIYDDVSFPFNYEITDRDVVSLLRYEQILKTDFFVEALYRNPGDNETIYYGEGWGKAGKLYLLKVGSSIDFKLNGILTHKNHRGELSLQDDDASAVWIDASDKMKEKVSFPIDILVMVKNDEGGSEHVIAGDIIRDIRSEQLPIPLHIKKKNQKENQGNYPMVYYEMIIRDSQKKYFFGGRASRNVKIDFGGAGLRLVATRPLPSDHQILKEAERHGL